MIKKRFLLLAGLAFFFAGCQTTEKLNNDFSPSPDYYSVKKEKGYTLVKIDLSSSDLVIFTNFSSRKVSDPDILINTTPFEKNGNLTGLAVSEKKLLSPPLSKYCALCLYKNQEGWKGEIIDSQDEIEKIREQNGGYPDIAAGGFWTILRDGKIFQFKNYKNYRLAAGLSENGKKLYLLCAKKKSYMDCAEILKKHGAETAMQFDGGHSAQMIIKGKKQIKAPRVKVFAELGFSNHL